ncbi:MAG: hypothetical protein Aureis2KO_02040 [Aureisphaera sp.]
MNRLFIIGNGFDLAHSLPTSYKDFLNSFWKNLKEESRDPMVSEIIYIDDSYFRFFNMVEINNFESFTSALILYAREYGYHFTENRFVLEGPNGNILYIKNGFFQRINQINLLNNWVDVENEYYDSLKAIALAEGLNKEQKKQRAARLNVEFNQVRDLLVRYLRNEVLNKHDFDWKISKQWEGTFDLLKPISIYGNDKPQLMEEFQFQADKTELIQQLKGRDLAMGTFGKIHFLIFNYTPTIDFYVGKLHSEGYQSTTNYIHGRVKNHSEYPVVFGFGDEIDEDYRKIENINDNEFLGNFKSFSYSQNGNYKALFDFIDGGKFQTVVIGHSCGLSDRVLLNSIFEHENCRSIKPIFFSKEGKDNYTDIVQNISRHFNDKSIMRRKIVNKTLIQPIPQNQIPLKN